MLATILSLLLSGAVADDGPGSQGPSPAELERAHSLLAGSWDVVSIVDDGETIGRELIRAKLAKDGRIRVATRSFEIVNPETGDSRTSAFRLDPSKLPRQIDIISGDDRIVRGIYMIEEDGLAICLQQKDGEPRLALVRRPGRVRVHAVANEAGQTGGPGPRSGRGPEQSRPIVKEDRKPTESEIKRVHGFLLGELGHPGHHRGRQRSRAGSSSASGFAQGGRVQFRGTRHRHREPEERRAADHDIPGRSVEVPGVRST